MDINQFVRYGEDALDCCDAESLKTLFALSNSSVSHFVSYDHITAKFITPIGVIGVYGNPKIRQQTSELIKFIHGAETQKSREEKKSFTSGIVEFILGL